MLDARGDFPSNVENLHLPKPNHCISFLCFLEVQKVRVVTSQRMHDVNQDTEVESLV